MLLRKHSLVNLIIFVFELWPCVGSNHAEETSKTVQAVLLARNKEHVLPYFLRLFEQLTYPKNKISLFIRSDHNQDRTNDVLQNWLSTNENKYLDVNKVLDENDEMYSDENDSEPWGYGRNMQLILHKENALHFGRAVKADYVWFLDLDVFIQDFDILQKMIKEHKTIVAPMLESTKAYSNFWGEMTESYWYKRSANYLSILNSRKKGCFSVPLVNSCVLVSLNDPSSENLSFYQHRIDSTNGIMVPFVDIIIFALSAKFNDIPMHICNKEKYGYILVSQEGRNAVIREIKQINELNIKYLGQNFKPTTVKVDDKHKSNKNKNQKDITQSEPTNFDVDKIYCINLARRPDRKGIMLKRFQEVQIQPTFFEAIDWHELSESVLKSLDVRQLRNYDEEDMTYGALGNLLSHYHLWNDVVENKYKQVIIFEDDVNFAENFVPILNMLMEDLETLQLQWDIVYLGRRVMRPNDDKKVPESDIIVRPSYSQLTIGYLLSYDGAIKLIEGNPLQKVIPLDEYFSIMFDKHPKENWKKLFKPRNLNAFSVCPLIITPTKFRPDEGFLTDIFDSPSLSENLEFENGRIKLTEDYQFLQKSEL